MRRSHGLERALAVLSVLNGLACASDAPTSHDDAGAGALASTDARAAMVADGAGSVPHDASQPTPGSDAAAPPATPIVPGDPGAYDVKFEVDTTQGMRPISGLIYGSNDGAHLSDDKPSVVRLGGNRWTAYNWENNASNAGSDYQFQNDNLLSASDTPGKAVSDAIDQAVAASAATVVTIPIVDYVSADKLGGGDVRNSGANYLTTRFKQNHPTKGAAFVTPPSSSDGAVYQDEFVAWLKATRPTAELLFSLDNEPDLWSSTHAEVHPAALTYAELWDRNYRYAKGLKAVWPEAKVLGVVSYGFNGYVNLQNASDAKLGNFLEWYLGQAQQKATADGVRVIDYLDLHWYSEAQGAMQRITGGDNSDAVVAAREQAPRSLWDKTYQETSWIRDFLGGPIDLLHWLQSKIDANYPGTGLSFSEWNYGGGDHISGAIAVADVLGIFGREGVALSTYWPLKEEPYARAGLRIYRNYDGQGARFGDTSVSATSSDVVNTSVYASIDAQNTGRVVLVAINKATVAKTAAILLTSATRYQSADVYQLVGTGPVITKLAVTMQSATNAFRYELPAQSVSVIVPMP